MPQRTRYTLHVNGRFYFRMAVPEALRTLIGRRELKRSLQTRDPRDANLRASILACQVDSMFEHLRRVQVDDSVEFPNHIARATQLALTLPALDAGFPTVVVPQTQPMVTPPVAEAVVDASSSTAIGEIRLSEVLDEYLHKKVQAKKWGDRFCSEFTSIIGLLIRVIGDKPVANITASDADEFFGTVIRLPKNLNKDRRYRDSTLAEVLASKPQPMSATNANKHMSRVAQLLNYAVQRDYLGKHHFSDVDLRLPAAKPKEAGRNIFTSRDLSAIFSTDVFTDPKLATSSFYWVPIILLHTGFRLNELCQMLADDIVTVGGIPCFRLQRTFEEQGFKNHDVAVGARVRDLPIHSAIIRLDFMAYVDRVRRAAVLNPQGYVQLFPDLVYQSPNGFGRRVSRWFNGDSARKPGLKQALGIITPGEKKDLHSFRHTLSTALERAGVPDNMAYRITDHARRGDAGAVYRKGFLLPQMQAALEEVGFAHELDRVKCFGGCGS